MLSVANPPIETDPSLPPSPSVGPRSWQADAWLRPAVAVAVIVVAYSTSLRTLLEGLQLDTPLSHLALVPVLSLVLAVLARRTARGPDIHDRQLDWIVSLPLIAAAIGINLLLPARLSTMFWLWRIDMLTLPLFAAGVVGLLFGVRTLWRVRVAVLFLLLAWPVPYGRMIDRFLGEATQLTIAALRLTSRVGGLAIALPDGDGSRFSILHGTTPVVVSVASACSGANGVVGFLLVGTACVLVMQGRRRSKLLWLTVGATVVWLVNVLRIMIVFLAAKLWGEKVAIDGFHPYIGLVVFNVAMVAMVLIAGRFGLRLAPAAPRAAAVPGNGATTPAPTRPTHRPAGPIAIVAVIAAGAVLGVFNRELRRNDLVANSFGGPRLTSFSQALTAPDGWRVSQTDQYLGYQRFFGAGSTWRRYAYYDLDPAAGGLSSANGVIADVIETPSRSALAAYGVDACYSFHGFEVTSDLSVDLGGGVVGSVLSWRDPGADKTWTSLYWHWPIKGADGTRYERTTLLMQDVEDLQVSSPAIDTALTSRLQLSLSDLLEGAADNEARDRLLSTRGFLVGFARELVQNRAAGAPQ